MFFICRYLPLKLAFVQLAPNICEFAFVAFVLTISRWQGWTGKWGTIGEWFWCITCRPVVIARGPCPTSFEQKKATEIGSLDSSTAASITVRVSLFLYFKKISISLYFKLFDKSILFLLSDSALKGHIKCIKVLLKTPD